MRELLGALLWMVLIAGPAHAQFDPSTIDTVPVGDIGNLDDPVALFSTGAGRVDYPYRIGTFEVTNDQYASFLDDVAASDPLGLFNPSMPGIVRSGVSGSFSYSALAALQDEPVVFVSWLDAARFVNWLENLESPFCTSTSARDSVETALSLPVGSVTELICRTEIGTYDLLAYADPGKDAVRSGQRDLFTETYATRGAATWFLPSDDEWHKAAYYDPIDPGADADTHGLALPTSPDYWQFPTQSDATPIMESPPGGTNSANYGGVVGSPTDVGSYPSSTSHYGAFDMAANVMEWTESPDRFGTGERVVLGGSFRVGQPAFLMGADAQVSNFANVETDFIGFRVAKAEPVSVPFSTTLEFEDLDEELVITIDAESLPPRPKLIASLELDAGSPDLEVEIEIFDCTTFNGGGFCPVGGISNPASSPLEAVGSFPTCDPGGPDPGDVCSVSVRPTTFGASGAPATATLSVRGDTVVPTGRISLGVVPDGIPGPDAEGNAGYGNLGLQSFVTEGDNFRWNYDGKLGAPLDGRVQTEVTGECTTEFPADHPASYEYDFLGNPAAEMVDCCVWLVDGFDGVTGTGELLFFVNLDPLDPLNLPPDSDSDGILDTCDNCPNTPNGPIQGTCVGGPGHGLVCQIDSDCPGPGTCSRSQEDPDLDGQGIACPEPGILLTLLPGIGMLVGLDRRRRA